MKSKINRKRSFANDKPSTKSGMTIVEVLIFITILSVVLVSLSAVTASVIRQSKANYNKTYATHYAEELAEWIRVQRDVVGWNSFHAKAIPVEIPAITSKVYCANGPITLTSTIALLTNTTCPKGSLSPAIFSRTVTFSQVARDNTASVKATIRVSWLEPGNAEYFSEVSTVYAPQ